MRLHVGFVTRLAVLYAAIFVLTGVQMAFFPVWLAAKGLNADLIGLTLALPMAMRVVAIPVVTYAADRRGALRTTLVVTAIGSVAGYALLGVSKAVPAIFAAYALASFAFTPVMPLTDAYALKELAARGRAYGPVRLWGSAAFILGIFAAGFVTDLLSALDLIWLIVAAAALMALAAVLLPSLETAAATGHAQPPPRLLFRDISFVAILVGASLIQASHAVYYGFSALAWRGEGLDGTTVAGLWALGVIAEIVLFALQARLPASLTPTVLLTIGALGGALRWTIMALDPAPGALPVLQLLHAASFGASHLGALSFIAHHASSGQSATAQGYYAIIAGLVMAGAVALSGWLYGNFGAAAYGAMALMAVAGGACVLIAQTLAPPLTLR